MTSFADDRRLSRWASRQSVALAGVSRPRGWCSPPEAAVATTFPMLTRAGPPARSPSWRRFHDPVLSGLHHQDIRI
jgi:hypothetical protein